MWSFKCESISTDTTWTSAKYRRGCERDDVPVGTRFGGLPCPARVNPSHLTQGNLVPSAESSRRLQWFPVLFSLQQFAVMVTNEPGDCCCIHRNGDGSDRRRVTWVQRENEQRAQVVAFPDICWRPRESWPRDLLAAPRCKG